MLKFADLPPDIDILCRFIIDGLAGIAIYCLIFDNAEYFTFAYKTLAAFVISLGTLTKVVEVAQRNHSAASRKDAWAVSRRRGARMSRGR